MSGECTTDDPEAAAQRDQQRPPDDVRAKNQITEHWITEDQLPQ